MRSSPLECLTQPGIAWPCPSRRRRQRFTSPGSSKGCEGSVEQGVETPLDQRSGLMGGMAGGSVERRALDMLDGVIEQAVDMVVQRFPASDREADETKRRMKETASREINRLVAEGQGM